MKRKFSVLLIIMILIISVLTAKVDAAYSFTAAMTASSQTVTASTEVVITVKVSNIDAGDNGINMVSAYLSYDSEVFESLTESSVEGTNGWVPAYAPGTGKVTLQKNSFVKSDEEIMQISLKTKSGLADGTQGKVQLSQISASNSASELTASAVSTTITIGAATANPPSQQVTPITPITPNNNVNTNTNTNINANTNTNTNQNNANRIPIVNNSSNEVENIVDKDMPYTGSDGSAMSKIILGVILIALITYIKIERMKDIK